MGAEKANDLEELLEAAIEAKKRIEQLCVMVNFLAVKLGMKHKVHAEDWVDFRENVHAKVMLRATRKADGEPKGQERRKAVRFERVEGPGDAHSPLKGSWVQRS